MIITEGTDEEFKQQQASLPDEYGEQQIQEQQQVDDYSNNLKPPFLVMSRGQLEQHLANKKIAPEVNND